MRNLVWFACVLVGANGLSQALIDEKKEMIMEHLLDCLDSEKATDADLAAMKAHKLPVTHEGRCAIFCVNKKLGVMSEDGSIEDPHTEWIDKVKADDPDTYAKMEKVYHECRNIEKKDDPCDTSFEFAHCIKQEADKVGLPKIFINGE